MHRKYIHCTYLIRMCSNTTALTVVPWKAESNYNTIYGVNNYEINMSITSITPKLYVNAKLCL